MRGFRLGLTVALIALILDQVSKWWIVGSLMTPPKTIHVTDFFNIVMVWNRGVSFGLFSDSDARWALSGLAAIVVVILLVWMKRAGHVRVLLALGLIVGGAAGNIIDRLRWGAVADFLDLHVAGYHWPAFNIADSAITIGVAILVVDSLIRRPSSP